jgi:hypothetical protein
MREPTDGKAGLEGIWKTEICIIVRKDKLEQA